MDIERRENSGETRIIVDDAEEESLYEIGLCEGNVNFGEIESRLAIQVDDTVDLPTVRLAGEGSLLILVPRGDGVRLPYFLPEEWQDDIATGAGENIGENVPEAIVGLGRLAVHNFETSQLMDDLIAERENLTDSGRGFLVEFKRRVELVDKIMTVEAALGKKSNIFTAEQNIKEKYLRIAEDEYGIDADIAGEIFDTILKSSIPKRREKRRSYPWSSTTKRALQRELSNDYRSLTHTWDSFLLSLSHRSELVREVGKIKKQLGMEVHQPGRQQELRNELMDTADLIGVSRSVAARLYDIMHSGSTELQFRQRDRD